MERKIKLKVKGYKTIDGAGVNLIRVLGHNTVREFDPILMLDSFDSVNPDEYTAGFPMHPHRGIETISYVYSGKMIHRDSLGNEASVENGEVQWMNAGSGIIHEEQVPAVERLLGVQLWLNLPMDQKMSKPSYHSIKAEQIREVEFEGGRIKVLAGSYGEYTGFKGEHLPLDYYDIHLHKNAQIQLKTDIEASVMLFTLIGEVYVGDELVEPKTAVKLTRGETLVLKTKNTDANVLFIKSRALNEPIAWAGSIVMNSEAELKLAYAELRNNSFIKEHVDY